MLIPTRARAMTARSPGPFSCTRNQLLAQGWTRYGITAAVRDGRLIRARNGVYLAPDTDPEIVESCRIGGRLTCTSELARRGVFVLDNSCLHVQLSPNAARLRRSSRRLRLHWQRGSRAPHPQATSVEVVDALIQSIMCQSPPAAIATLDSALHLGVIDEDDLDEIFGTLPRKYRVLRRHLDGAAEAGTESLVRVMVRRLGRHVETQVTFRGIGRVDLLVDGWLVLECDSEEHHGGWAAQKRDRRRDQKLAAQGYVVYRPIAEDIMWHPELVVDALKGLLGASHRAAVRR